MATGNAFIIFKILLQQSAIAVLWEPFRNRSSLGMLQKSGPVTQRLILIVSDAVKVVNKDIEMVVTQMIVEMAVVAPECIVFFLYLLVVLP